MCSGLGGIVSVGTPECSLLLGSCPVHVLFGTVEKARGTVQKARGTVEKARRLIRWQNASS